MKAVLDTNVLVAAFRSRGGASFEVFRRLRVGEWTAIVSNHLLFEYEEVLKRNAAEMGLALADADELINAVSARAEEWTLPTDGSRSYPIQTTSRSSSWHTNRACD
ncbi:MAG: PIN domain-containing protein [Verrucomicrobia bacterium]|nr:PIN domain-containing protein [Verrucomicrobiota bacterium]